MDSASELVSYVVKPNYRTLGPKFGKNMPAVAAAVAALPADETGDRPLAQAGRSVIGGRRATGRGVRVRPRRLRRRDPRARRLRGGARRRHSRGHLDRLSRRNCCSEGLARELVHHIQNTRKAADFQIDDRIHLRVSGPAEIADMLAVHGDWVKKETLAVSLEVETDDGEAAASGDAHTAGESPPTRRSRCAARRWSLPREAEGQRSAGDRGGRQSLRFKARKPAPAGSGQGRLSP